MSPPGGLPILPPVVSPLFLYLLTAALLVYLPFLGVVIGGSCTSLVLNFLGRENGDERSVRLSRELAAANPGNPAILFLAGALPLPLIAFLCERVLSGASPLPWFSWILPFAALLAGCALLDFYRSAVRQPAELPVARFVAGAAGLLAVVLGASLLLALTGSLFNPEKLRLIRGNPVFLPSFKSVTGFLLFLALSFGLTGGIVLRSVGRPAETAEGDREYGEYVRAIGRRLAIASALAMPPLVVLDLVSLPDTGLSLAVFAAAIVVLLLALAIFLLLFLLPERSAAGSGARVSLLYFLIFLAALSGNRAAVANAFLGRAVPAAPPAAAKVAGEGRPAMTEPAIAEKGKAVFDAVCAACHRFDARVVGPPLTLVVPKYGGDVEKLKRFIRDPVKVDPAYPPMPKPALSEEEIDAVARYLLAQLRGGG